jgi:5-methylcytosine-specific restriction enzyme A
MLQCDQTGRPYNKAEINRALRERGQPLSGRRRSSIEYRMRNISAVLADERRPIVTGYAPAKNVGDDVRTKLAALLARHGLLGSGD